MALVLQAGSSTHIQLTALLPYVAQFLTFIIAVVAIIAGRRSNKDTVTSELKQRMWEKRTDAYLDILRETLSFDPRDITPHTVAKQEAEFPILERLETQEWLQFTARVEAVATDEVRYLFSLWERAVAGWTWILAKAIIHFDPTSKAHKESQAELETSYTAVFTARMILTDQIRAELRFEQPKLPPVELVAPEAYLGAITELRAYEQVPAKYPLVQPPRIRTYKREDHGQEFGIQLP